MSFSCRHIGKYRLECSTEYQNIQTNIRRTGIYNMGDGPTKFYNKNTKKGLSRKSTFIYNKRL